LRTSWDKIAKEHLKIYSRFTDVVKFDGDNDNVEEEKEEKEDV